MTDPNINMETGETTNQRSPRYQQWAAFFVFSTITMGSAIQVKNKSEPVTQASKYAVACSVITFVATALSLAAQSFPVYASMFVGTQIEGVVIIVLVAFWAAIASIVTDAADGIAPIEDSADAVQNANLYYFSWAGFITSLVLLVSFLRDSFGLDVVGELRTRAARLQWWAALFGSCIVVMGSAARVHKQDCQYDSGKEFSNSYCRKTKLAIAAGTIGALFALLVVYTKVIRYTSTTAATPFAFEFAVSAFLIILNGFNVAYTTSADAPGSSVGNLYYFSWGMFLCTSVIVSECYVDYSRPPATDSTESFNNGNNKRDNNGDIEVETFDDAI